MNESSLVGSSTISYKTLPYGSAPTQNPRCAPLFPFELPGSSSSSASSVAPSPFGLRSKPLSQMSSREIGREGERVAASYLASCGLEVCERNWRRAGVEADIVCRDGATSVLVEVKTRLALGEKASVVPELAVNERKRDRYRKAALLYIAQHLDVQSVRFDVIALAIVSEELAHLRHLMCAFGWDQL